MFIVVLVVTVVVVAATATKVAVSKSMLFEGGIALWWHELFSRWNNVLWRRRSFLGILSGNYGSVAV